MEWVAAQVPDAAPELERAGFSPWLAVALARRGVTDAASAERYLNPSLDQLHDPFLLAGMEAGVERLLRARDGKEKIAIVGDYDVDGVTSTALLLAVLGACGIEAVPILPNRLAEGYGFQAIHVERARDQGCRLIVTADCGSSSTSAVQAAFDAGLDVLVTDHHLPNSELPAGTLHINPRQAGCTYPFRDLAAAGLAFKLCLAVAGRCGKDVDPARLLRIACLGTIADLVPLHGENRVIAALGLRALAEPRSEGLKALIKQSGVKPPFSAADVGYRLGPRLNAAGRLDNADKALELLMSRDPVRAAELAAELDAWNRERQMEEAKVVEEARKALIDGGGPLPPILVAWSPEWHKGVVGIAAGRLAKELRRPTLLLAVEGDLATGSGRSVPGLELHSFLDRWRDSLERFGGHSQAVGLTARLDRLDGLRLEWEEAGRAWPEELLAGRHEYEMALEPRQITNALVKEMARLEPFGQGNPRPLVRIGPLRLDGAPRAFGGGHLSARTRANDGSIVELVGWGWQGRADDLDGAFEVLGYVEDDSWKGVPVLRLVDVRAL
jgi:single-stranded-DNA-specific exonuclease